MPDPRYSRRAVRSREQREHARSPARRRAQDGAARVGRRRRATHRRAREPRRSGCGSLRAAGMARRGRRECRKASFALGDRAVAFSRRLGRAPGLRPASRSRVSAAPRSRARTASVALRLDRSRLGSALRPTSSRSAAAAASTLAAAPRSRARSSWAAARARATSLPLGRGLVAGRKPLEVPDGALPLRLEPILRTVWRARLRAHRGIGEHIAATRRPRLTAVSTAGLRRSVPKAATTAPEVRAAGAARVGRDAGGPGARQRTTAMSGRDGELDLIGRRHLRPVWGTSPVHGSPSSAAHGLWSSSASRRWAAVATSVRVGGRTAARDAEPAAVHHAVATASSNDRASKATSARRCWLDSFRHHGLKPRIRASVTRARNRALRAQTDAGPTGSRGSAAADPRGAGLLAGAGVAVQRAALDGLVDRPHELAVLGVGAFVVARGDRALEAAEVRLDLRGVAAVLEPLALGPQDPLLL